MLLLLLQQQQQQQQHHGMPRVPAGGASGDMAGAIRDRRSQIVAPNQLQPLMKQLARLDLASDFRALTARCAPMFDGVHGAVCQMPVLTYAC
jgi:hypothetical protein